MSVTSTRAGSKSPTDHRYNTQELHALGVAGKAFKNPDGHYSFPIANRMDLADAILAVGRAPAGLRAAIRRFIRKRAAQMGLSHLIPASWKSDGSLVSGPENASDPDPGEDGTQNESFPFGAGSSLGSGDGTGSRKKGRHTALDRLARLTELRAEVLDDHQATVTGYASVTGRAYSVTDQAGEFQETIARGAFTACLGGPTVLQFDHTGIPLAKTTAGTLELDEDARGLKYTAWLDLAMPSAQDLVAAIRNGSVTASSFGFTVAPGGDSWSADMTKRVISAVGRVYDTSPVSWPANPWATAQLASNGTRSQQTSYQHRLAGELDLMRVRRAKTQYLERRVQHGR